MLLRGDLGRDSEKRLSAVVDPDIHRDDQLAEILGGGGDGVLVMSLGERVTCDRLERVRGRGRGLDPGAWADDDARWWSHLRLVDSDERPVGFVEVIRDFGARSLALRREVK